MDDTGNDQDDDSEDRSTDDDTDTDRDEETDTGDDADTDGSSDDDGGSDDDPASGEADDGSRLEELGDRIESVRAEAEDVVEGVAEPDEEYHESGSDESKEADDQTAAPG